jgi:hypothetical protein
MSRTESTGMRNIRTCGPTMLTHNPRAERRFRGHAMNSRNPSRPRRPALDKSCIVNCTPLPWPSTTVAETSVRSPLPASSIPDAGVGLKGDWGRAIRPAQLQPTAAFLFCRSRLQVGTSFGDRSTAAITKQSHRRHRQIETKCRHLPDEI